AVHQGQQDEADGLLQGRELVQLVEDQLRVGVALEVEDDLDRLAVAGAALVLDLGDALDPLVLDQLADGLGQAVARLLLGDLADDDLGAAALLVDLGPGAERDLAAAGAVAVADALPPADDAAGGEVRPGDQLHQLLDADLGLVDEADQAVADLAEVVRR